MAGHAVSDYSSPVKRQRMEEIQKKHQTYYGISSAPQGGMPDTLRIGMQMKDFVVAPPKVNENEWIAYMVYHISDRMKNLWNLFMYFCLDERSIKRINASRSIQYYGIPPTGSLTRNEEAFYANEKSFCRLTSSDKAFVNTHLTINQGLVIRTWPLFIDILMIEFENLKTDAKTMGKNENDTLPENFRKQLTPFFTNAFSMFEHLYNHHYGDICSMGVLLHFNSLFTNIVALSDTYGILAATEETLGTHLLGFYKKILQEEFEHIKTVI